MGGRIAHDIETIKRGICPECGASLIEYQGGYFSFICLNNFNHIWRKNGERSYWDNSIGERERDSQIMKKLNGGSP